ncbi:hypothetical protein OIO90_001598 [Microbotryomycetes sp. JL221]|nr:hypothetical protein OIO90_001598 [Microbotryomycetes sp. JL221]
MTTERNDNDDSDASSQLVNRLSSMSSRDVAFDGSQNMTAAASSSTDPNAASSNSSTTKTSFTAALTRAVFGTLAFLFKRPIRLFRPVKISTMTGIQAIAEEQGRSVTPAFVRGLIRKEGSAESFLNARLGSPPHQQALAVPFLSGAFAGSIQSILSAPLDNARLLLLRRQRIISMYGRRRAARLEGAFTGWSSLIKMALLQQSRSASAGEQRKANTTRQGRIRQAQQWARRGWSLFSLSLIKDSVSFGVFFLCFEMGRGAARRVGLYIDGLSASDVTNAVPDDDEEYSAEFEGGTRVSRRSTTSLLVQSFLILATGGLAGLAFAVVARPFERARAAIWEGRARWAEHDGRLRVVEELALKTEEPRSQQQTISPGRSAREAGSRRYRAPSAKRHTVRIQVARRRGIGRTFVRAERHQLKTHLFSRRRAQLLEKKAAVSTKVMARSPMPSASLLVKQAVVTFGLRQFLFASNLDWKQLHLPSHHPTRPAPARARQSRGPTRLSARNRIPRHSWLRTSGYRVARVLAYVPPYAVGFFAYSLLSGDLR